MDIILKVRRLLPLLTPEKLICDISIFMTTMAAMKGANLPGLGSLCTPGIFQCFANAIDVDKRVIQESPSLQVLYTTLEQRLAAQYSSLL